jgi:hypothetical protein
MRIEQSVWSAASGWRFGLQQPTDGTAGLVLLFGGSAVVKARKGIDAIRERYPNAHLIGCSTAGEIAGTQVLDESLVATAVTFEHTTIHGAQLSLGSVQNSTEAGEVLARALPHPGLIHVFVLSDGLKVNGSELVASLTAHLPERVTVTGGLSADGSDFKETVVLWDNAPMNDSVAVVGFYGDRLQVGCASLGGWDSFGPDRLITRSRGNVLYEFDGQSALALYKKYLGDQAEGLPSTGLLFPISLRRKDNTSIVRTILAVNEEEQSMTFAGDVPEGSYARLMKANFDRLIDGAAGAAKSSSGKSVISSPDLAILISCVGRRLILGQRIEEEVESVRDVFGASTVLTGFYSYGEISPFTPGARCELHNQTMTITTLSER